MPWLLFAKQVLLCDWMIDYQDLHHPQKCKQVCQKLSKACQETGFIIINNPPLKESEIDAMYAESRLFFELPEEKKQQILGRECHYQRGYCPLRTERAKDHFLADLRESFTGALYPDNHYPELWPNRDRFAKVTKRASFKLMRLAKEVLQVLAVDAGLDQDCLANYIKGPNPSVFRAMHYPNFPRYMRNKIWAAEHTDMTFVSMVVSPWIRGSGNKPIEGIEVEDEEGSWVSLKVPKHSVIVRVGDLLQNLSNGYFKSARCRARDTQSLGSLERYVMVLYCHPSGSTDLTPAPCFVARTKDKAVHFPSATRDELVSEWLIDINFGDEALLGEVANSDLIERMKAFKIASPRVLKQVKEYRRKLKRSQQVETH